MLAAAMQSEQKKVVKEAKEKRQCRVEEKIKIMDLENREVARSNPDVHCDSEKFVSPYLLFLLLVDAQSSGFELILEAMSCSTKCVA